MNEQQMPRRPRRLLLIVVASVVAASLAVIAVFSVLTWREARDTTDAAERSAAAEHGMARRSSRIAVAEECQAVIAFWAVWLDGNESAGRLEILLEGTAMGETLPLNSGEMVTIPGCELWELGP